MIFIIGMKKLQKNNATRQYNQTIQQNNTTTIEVYGAV